MPWPLATGSVACWSLRSALRFRNWFSYGFPWTSWSICFCLKVLASTGPTGALLRSRGSFGSLLLRPSCGQGREPGRTVSPFDSRRGRVPMASKLPSSQGPSLRPRRSLVQMQKRLGALVTFQDKAGDAFSSVLMCACS